MGSIASVDPVVVVEARGALRRSVELSELREVASPELDPPVLVENRALEASSTPRPSSTRICSRAGVLDPTKVVRSALQNAASVAALMLTTEVLIAEKPEKKSGGGGTPDMGGMGGMGGMDDMM